MSLKTVFFDAFASRPQPAPAEVIRSEVTRYESDRVRQLLATTSSVEINKHDLRTVVEGNLWMLAPEAFLYFLPAFLQTSLSSYSTVSVFASELIGALTEPARSDVVEAIDSITQAQTAIGLIEGVSGSLRQQQLEWFDSGTPTAIFHERFDQITQTEGAAVLTFLRAFQTAHGENFPFDELEIAIDRYWSQYQNM